MRNFITAISTTTNFANITGTVRKMVTGTGTGLLRALCDAWLLLKRLAKPVAEDMVAVRVYRHRPVTGRRMSMRMQSHSCSSGRQFSGNWSGSWSESAVRNRF